MHIFTADGWRELPTVCVNQIWERVSYDPIDKKYVPDGNGQLRMMGTRPDLMPAHVERNGYAGVFPSKEVCEYLNWTREKMKYFDDGVRYTYDRPDRIVEVEPSNANHPIISPPETFRLVTDRQGDKQWVMKRSKYA